MLLGAFSRRGGLPLLLLPLLGLLLLLPLRLLLLLRLLDNRRPRGAGDGLLLASLALSFPFFSLSVTLSAADGALSQLLLLLLSLLVLRLSLL